MSCYKFNSDKMYYDITDNIAFITSLKTNFYYGINEFGTQIFQNLVKGIPTEKIFTKLKKLGIEENNFSFFVKDLVENEILVDSVESDKEIKIEKITDDLNFELNKYNNLYKTLKLYKIHNNKTVEDSYLENSINNGNNINTLSVQKDFVPKVSVIIPIYNVEKYLYKCLNSVINQTLSDIEIICVNDCSTDKSLSVLREYEAVDKRIKIIDLSSNMGVSFARNVALDIAQGEYIAFLDGDDWWECDMLEKTFNKACQEKADIVQFTHNCISGQTSFPFFLIDKLKKITNKKIYEKDFYWFVNTCWDKIYNTKFLKDNHIQFPLNIVLSEDSIFCLECFSHKPKIEVVPESLYNYRISRKDSLIKSYDMLLLNQINAAYKMFNSDFYKNSDTKYKKLCVRKILIGILHFLGISIKNKVSKKIYISELRKFISYVKKEVPDEWINTFGTYKSLKQFVLL